MDVSVISIERKMVRMDKRASVTSPDRSTSRELAGIAVVVAVALLAAFVGVRLVAHAIVALGRALGTQ